jgi:hypothetical protein
LQLTKFRASRTFVTAVIYLHTSFADTIVATFHLQSSRSMSGLFKALASKTCSHEFCWPRRRDDHTYYQTCVRCGSEYEYDWNTMTRRDLLEPAPAVAAPETSASPKRSKWMPRSRRLRVQVPIMYRQAGTETWYSGMVQNISHSGVLFEAAQLLPDDADVEMVFEMPMEITGQPSSRVFCRGYVARSVLSARKPPFPHIGAAISGYTFLHEDE